MKKWRKWEIKKRKWAIKKRKWAIKKNNIVTDSKIKKSMEKPKEIKSPKEDKNTTDSYPNWFDKNKFKNILAIIDSNKFNYKNKIGEFKYIDIKDLVNNIKNNTISEISAKEGLNVLKQTKNAEIIKYKKRTPGQIELLNLFNDLSDTILTDETLKSKSQKDKTLMSSKDEKEKEKKNEDENKNILLEYMENIDDKLFKKYSNSKNFNRFIDKFDRATNEENKEKVVKKLKDINSFVKHYAQMEDDYNEYKCKLFDIINAVDYFLYE